MAVCRSLAPVLLLCFLACHVSVCPSLASSDGFVQCLSENVPMVYTQSSDSFDSVLVSYVRNPKFLAPDTVRPLCIVTPTDVSHVQAAVVCGRRHGVRLRVRSGGHDYEGLSYRSARPEVFAVVDLNKLRAVRVNELEATAWVGSGATLGELYYAIAKVNPQLAFSAGVCPTVGVGGHFSGGGFGMMVRKHGLAVDHVIDAMLVDASGRLLNRMEMGPDLFWAIRGGGGQSFGIVVSWMVRLVRVPATVTVVNIQKTLDQGALDILTKWQEVAPAFPDDLQIRATTQNGVAMFQALYLGTCNALLPLMAGRFPDLGMTYADCKEMTWLQSVAFIYSGDMNTESILNRTINLSTFSKAKSDYVRKAITKDVWQKIYSSWFTQPGAGLMILEPSGGMMSRVPGSATPFPHRQGVLYNIQYISLWTDSGTAAQNWIGDFYNFMAQFVSNNTREAYVNYRDLDIGENIVVGNVTSYDSARMWGERYFMNNFRRLAIAKGRVDPEDYFRNEQSIPPLVQFY